MTMQVSAKQAIVLTTVRDRAARKVFLIGALGTSKTYVMAYALINIAYQFGGSLIPMGRKTIAEARVSTLLSFLEVMDDMGLEQDIDYRIYGQYGGNDLKIIFTNKSIIQFIPLDHTKDRDWQRIKGINATAAGVDEVDGVMKSGFDMLASRVGRRNKNGAPDVVIAACNPSEAWIKEEVYIPYRKKRLPEGTAVVEFNVEDSFLYSSGFYDRYKDNPPQWIERYLRNNWDYLDDDNSLFKGRILDNITVAKQPSGTAIAGQDVAREGKDRSVTAKIQGNMLTDIVVYTKSDLEYFATEKEKAAPPYSAILGRKFIKYCQDNDIGYQHAAGDAVGLGAGFIDFCRSQQFPIEEYKAGARPFVRKPSPMELRAMRRQGKSFVQPRDYDMLRSHVAASMALDMEKGEFLFYEGCPHLGELKKELLYHGYEVKDKLMKVESKQHIKDRLGKSPDIADAVFIAYYKWKFKKIATFDMIPDPDDSTPDNPDGDNNPGEPITAGVMDKRF